MEIKSSELGVTPSELKLTEGHDLDDYCTLEEFKDLFSTVKCSLVDLNSYRPPAYSWRNSCGTLVLKLDSDPSVLLQFVMLVLRTQPNEYQHLITEEGDIFVRIWWD